MKVLIIGSGGREHALAWKIAQSPLVDKLYCAPGNAGIAQVAECVDLPAEEVQALLKFALREKIDLTVVGPCSVDSFNNAAFNALATSNPTYPLPPEYPAPRAFFTVTFYYNEEPPR